MLLLKKRLKASGLLPKSNRISFVFIFRLLYQKTHWRTGNLFAGKTQEKILCVYPIRQ